MRGCNEAIDGIVQSRHKRLPGELVGSVNAREAEAARKVRLIAEQHHALGKCRRIVRL
jgi:hypothetical protein